MSRLFDSAWPLTWCDFIDDAVVQLKTFIATQDEQTA